MPEPIINWRDRFFKRSVIGLAVLTVAMFAVGFLLLPSSQKDFTVQGLWAGLCRAAGVPTKWNADDSATLEGRTTQVMLDRSMARKSASDAVGRGATLALNCTMCHGAQGMSTSNAPNLAGQYQEVVIKQLEDYRGGHRSSPIMEALAKGLKDRDILDLAAYYAYLPKARTAPTTYNEKNLPALVRVGDPLRNIAPCISCHGQVDQKLGAPWLEGMPKQYLVNQLNAFIAGTRRNDPEAQMRNVARTMTPSEIDEVATFYARKARPGTSTIAAN